MPVAFCTRLSKPRCCAQGPSRPYAEGEAQIMLGCDFGARLSGETHSLPESLVDIIEERRLRCLEEFAASPYHGLS